MRQIKKIFLFIFLINTHAFAASPNSVLENIERLSFELGKEIAIASPCFASPKCKVKSERRLLIANKKNEVNRLISDLVENRNLSTHIYKKVVYLSNLQKDYAAAKILRNSFMGGTLKLINQSRSLLRKLPKEISKVRSVVKINI